MRLVVCGSLTARKAERALPDYRCTTGVMCSGTLSKTPTSVANAQVRDGASSAVKDVSKHGICYICCRALAQRAPGRPANGNIGGHA